MTVNQTDFHDALMDPGRTVPAGLTDGQGRAAGRRFGVYRNNVAHSLTEALAAGFPVIAKLIGPRNFRRLAGVFLRRHPPQSPILSRYGAQMPAFLEGFEPLAHLGYLPDVARLEQAIRQSYHAADSTPADPATLQSLSPDALADLRFGLAPSLRLLRSAWPIHAIWAYNLDGGPKPAPSSENALILRPAYDPQVMAISDGMAEFIQQLRDGTPLGGAQDAALAADARFDLSEALTHLLGGNAITDISVKGP